ncbi:MAG: phage portal protein [Thermoguttaceae bacterium]|nr:phage portal protein [Thermoguttaceae bacterium]
MSKRKKKTNRRSERDLRLDALTPEGRTREVVWTSQTSDFTIDATQRLGLRSVGREMQDNFALAAFAIRIHTANLSRYRLSVDTNDQGFNRRLEALFADWAETPEKCDVARRRNFNELLRLIELLRVREGDVGVLRLKNNAIQVVEGDRIRNEGPIIDDARKRGETWIQGVRVAESGRPLAYNLCRRRPYGGYEQERVVSADYFDLVGYYNAVDQIRGVSPLTAALLPFAQIYDAQKLALARMKIEQLIGFVTYEEAATACNQFGSLRKIAEDGDGSKRFAESFGSGAHHLRLNSTDRFETVQAAAPGSNFQPFLEFCIRVALAALDIPYSFLKGSDVNFYGSRGELNNYVNGCRQKQEGMRVFLNRLFRWLCRYWVLTGAIEFPPGLTVENLPFTWIGASVPWWRLIDDAKGLVLATKAGLLNLEDVANWHQTELYENVERNAFAVEFARAKGFPLAIDPNLQTNVGL